MAATEDKKVLATEAKETVKKTVKKATASKKEAPISTEHSNIAFKVLVEPWITEKTHAAIADNKYTFRITRLATKKQVKLAIEGTYGVKVEKITVVNLKPKKKAYGRHMGTKSGIKKATVTLKKGDKIELFQGA